MTDNPYRYPYVPIGGIIEWDGTGLTGAPDLSTPEKVAAVYGYGTWERYGTDRVTVGAGGEYAAGATGGEKEHTLTVNELANHDHNLLIVDNISPLGGGTDFNCLIPMVSGTQRPATMSTCGGNQPHNNMQPYIAAYRYRRIA